MELQLNKFFLNIYTKAYLWTGFGSKGVLNDIYVYIFPRLETISVTWDNVHNATTRLRVILLHDWTRNINLCLSVLLCQYFPKEYDSKQR